MQRISSIVALCTALALVASPSFTTAQPAFPIKPVRLITPYEPGGSSTILSRLVGQKLMEMWGYSVIIDNRPGGNTIIGTQAGARATPTPDGCARANSITALQASAA